MVQNLLKSHRFKAFFRALLPRRMALWIKGQVDNVNLKDLPAMDDASRLQLRDYYRKDIEKLGRLLGRDLGAWLK